MASTGRKPATKKQTTKMKTKWVNNALRSIGLAAKSEISTIAPSTYSVEQTVSSTIRDSIKTMRQPKQGNLRTQMKNNKYVKLADNTIKNAISDLKSGKLVNDERTDAAMEESMSGGFDDDYGYEDDTGFDDWDDWDEEEESITLNYVDNGGSADTGRQIMAGAASISSSVRASAEANITAQQAAMDAMVGVSSNLLYSIDSGFGTANGHLSNMDATLTSILEFHQDSTTNFYETAIATFEKLGSRLGGDDDDYDEGSRDDEDIASAIAGKTINGQKLKDLLKKNIKNAMSSSSAGQVAGFLSEDMLNIALADPVGYLTKGVFSMMIPKALEQSIKAIDNTVKDVIPNMMVKFGRWQDLEGRGLGTSIKKFFGKVFGIRSEKIENLSEREIGKESATFDARTRNSIVEVLPKYARESTAYLREIAMHVTKKSDEDLLSGQQIFNNQTGFYESKKDIEKTMKEAMEGTFMDAFSESEFGKILTSISSSGNFNASRTKQFNELLPMFYGQLASARNLDVSDFNVDDKDSAINQILNLLPKTGEKDGKKVHYEEGIKILRESIRQMNKSNKGLASVSGAQLNAFKNWNDLMTEMNKDPEAYNTLTLGLNQKTNMYEYMDKLMGNKAAVKAREDAKKAAEKEEEDAKKAEDKELNKANRGRKRRNIKNAVAAGIQEFDDDQAAEMDREVKSGRLVNGMVGEGFEEKMNRASQGFKNAAYAIMRGDTLGVLKEYGNAMVDGAKSIWNSTKHALFGDGEDGESKGLFTGIKEAVGDTYHSIMLRVNGKPYTDSKGETHQLEDGEKPLNATLKDVFGNIKEGIRYKLFGGEDEDGNQKQGVISKFGDSLTRGLVGWKQALFGGKGDKDVDEMTPEDLKAEKENIKNAMVKATPKAILGTGGGALFGGLAGGSLLGTMIGGPIGGAVIGLGTSILSNSSKFKDWLFGPEIENPDGSKKRIGGFISGKMQDFIKKNKKGLIGGAVLGAVKGMVFPGSGMLTTILGGPIAGAAMGMGMSILKDSKMFKEFLYGNEKTGKRGIITAITGSFKRKKTGDENDKEKKGILKSLGMGALGIGGGAAAAALAGKVGILGFMASPYGIIGASVVGLSVGLAASGKKFAKMLFGEKDEETGERKGGLLTKFTNFMTVEVMQPIKSKMLEWGNSIQDMVKWDILENLRRPFILLTDKFKESFQGVKESILEPLQKFGMNTIKSVVEPMAEVAAEIFRPVRAVVGKIADFTLAMTKRTIALPFKIVGKVTGFVTSGIGKALGAITGAAFGLVKGIGGFIFNKVKWLFGGLGNVLLTVIGGVRNFIGDRVRKSQEKKGLLSKTLNGISYLKAGIAGLRGDQNGQDFAARDIEKRDERAEEKKRRRRRRDLDHNRQIMAQMLGYNVKEFTEENMNMAIAEAKRQKKRIHFRGGDDREYDTDPRKLMKDTEAAIAKGDGPAAIEALKHSDDPDIRRLGYTMDINFQLKQIQETLGLSQEEAKEYYDSQEYINQKKEDAEKAGLKTDDHGNTIDDRDAEDADDKEKSTLGNKIIERSAEIAKAGGVAKYVKKKIRNKFHHDEEEYDESDSLAVLQHEMDENNRRRSIMDLFRREGRAHAKGGDAKKGQAILVGDGGKHPEDTSSAEIVVPKEDSKVIPQGPKGFNVIINGMSKEVRRDLTTDMKSSISAATDEIESEKADFQDHSKSDGKTEKEKFSGSGLDLLRQAMDENEESDRKSPADALELLQQELTDSGYTGFKKSEESGDDSAATVNAHSDTTDADDKVGSYANLADKKAKLQEKEADKGFKGEVVELLKGLHGGNKEHHGLFSKLWGAKGIIKVALLGGITWLTSKLTGWDIPTMIEKVGTGVSWLIGKLPGVIDVVGNAISTVGDTVKTIMDGPLGDIAKGIGAIVKKIVGDKNEDEDKSKTEQINDATKKAGKVVGDVFTLNPVGAINDFVMDENGDWDGSSTARAKFMAQNLMKAPNTKAIKHGPFKTVRRIGRLTNNTLRREVQAPVRAVKAVSKKGFKGAIKDAGASMKSGIANKFKSTKVGKFVSKFGKKGATKAATEAGENLLEKGTAELAENTVKESAENVAKKAITKSAKEVAEKEVGNAVSKGIKGKITNLIKSGMETMFNKLGTLLKKPGNALKACKTKILEKLVAMTAKHFPKLSAKFSAALAKEAAGDVVLPAKAVFAILGAVDGATGAKKLFETTDPDGIMIAISSAWGALSAATLPAAVIEIVLDFISGLTGTNYLHQICWQIYYTLVGGEDSEKGKKLKAGQKKMNKEYQSKKDSDLKKNYNTMKATGRLKNNETFDEYKEAVKKGDYKATFESRDDYIDREHGGVLSKIGRGISGDFKSAKNFVMGKEKYYDAEEDIYYTKYTKDGVDGYIMTYDPDGKYTVGGEGSGLIDARMVEEDVQKRWTKVKNGLWTKGKNFMSKITGNDAAQKKEEEEAKKRYEADMKGKTSTKKSDSNKATLFKKIGKWTTEKVSSLTNLTKKLFGSDDDTKNSKSISKKTSNKVYYMIDYTGYYKRADNGTYEFYNLNGDIVDGKEITFTELQKLLMNNMVVAGDAPDTTKSKKETKNTISELIKEVSDVNKKSAQAQKSNWGVLGSLLEAVGIKVDTKKNSSSTKGGKGTIEINTTKHVMGGRGEMKANVDLTSNSSDTNAGFTYFSQNDPRWKNQKYISNQADDGATMGDSGCGPTAMAMVADTLKGTKQYTPEQMSQLAVQGGFRDESGTNNQFIDYAGSQLGLKSTKISKPSTDTLQSASKENPIILNGLSNNDGPFTDAGHYVVAVGHDDAGNVIVNDPRGKEYSRSYSPAELANTTSTAWQFSGGRGTKENGRRRVKGVLGGRGPAYAMPQQAIESNTPSQKRTYQNGDGGVGGVPDEVRNGTLGNATGSNAGTGWLGTVQKVKTYASQQIGHYSQSEHNVNVNIDGKNWIMPRPDCSGFVSLCLKVYGVLPEDSGGFNSSGFLSANIDKFSNQDWPGWEGCQPGDILVRNGHVEVFARNDGNTHYVYNWGSNSSAASPGETTTGHASEGYTKILRPSEAGAASFEGTTNSTSSDSTGSSESGSFLDTFSSILTKFGTKALNGILTGNWDYDFSDSSSSSSDSSASNNGGSYGSSEDLSGVSLDQEQTAKMAYTFYKNQGYGDEAIAGLFGNFQQESQMNPRSIQKNGAGPAAGIVQWENYNSKSARWKEMSDYAQSKGREWTDLTSQLEFVDKELSGNCSDTYTASLLNKRGGIAAFKQQTDIHQAVRDFEETFERAGTPEMEKRYGYADSWYQKIKNGELKAQTYQNGDGGVGGVPDQYRYGYGTGKHQNGLRRRLSDGALSLHGGRGMKRPNLLKRAKQQRSPVEVNGGGGAELYQNMMPEEQNIGGYGDDANLREYHIIEKEQDGGYGQGKKEGASKNPLDLINREEKKLDVKKTFDTGAVTKEIDSDLSKEMKSFDKFDLRGGRGLDVSPNLDYGTSTKEVINNTTVTPITQSFDSTRIEELLGSVVSLLENINGNTKEIITSGSNNSVVKQGDNYVVNNNNDNRNVSTVNGNLGESRNTSLARRIARGI